MGVDRPRRKFQICNLATELTMITYWNKAALKTKQNTYREDRINTTTEKHGTPFFCSEDVNRKWQGALLSCPQRQFHSQFHKTSSHECVFYLPAPGCLQGMQTFVWDIQNHFSCSKAISTYMLGLSKTDPAVLRASEGITQKPITDFNLDDHDGGSGGGGGWEMDRFNSRVVKGMRWNWW